jgi:hypothetical protein
VRPILVAAIIASACASVTGCADLEPLGTCGNGVVEANIGEDCDDPDDPTCADCRLVCSMDLPAAGACPDGELCCRAGQRCGLDQICRAPAGAFASPTAFIPFPATQHAIADVDGDGIGDVFGVDQLAATFLYGTLDGAITRTGSTPLPTASRPESQVTFLVTAEDPDAPVIVSASTGAVIPTTRGFSVLVATDTGRMVSPPLPDLDIEQYNPGGDGPVPDRALAAAPTAGGDLLAVVMQHRADDSAGGNDRAVLDVFDDRALAYRDLAPCGAPFPDNETLFSGARIVVANAGAGEYAIVVISQGAASTIGPSTLCVYATPVTAGAAPLVLPIPSGRTVTEVYAAQLDGDGCPEVVTQAVDLDGGVVDIYDLDGVDCRTLPPAPNNPRELVSGRLLGVGDLDADGRDEILVDDRAYGNALGLPVVLAGLQLPGALTAAVVADVNRDGAADIVATGTNDLVVVLRVAAGWAPRTLAAAGTLDEPVTADFDADTFPDVAVIEENTDGRQRVIVAFGGPQGPQGLDSIGDIRAPRSLNAFVDREPALTSDAFADLLLLHSDSQGFDVVSQFHGASTRSLTSEIDLSGPGPQGDDGLSFGRTMIGGELLPPADDGTDFCAISLGEVVGPTEGIDNSLHAFCVGGQGVTIAAGSIDHAEELARNRDRVDPGEQLPLFTAAQVDLGGARPVIAALRSDGLTVVPRLILMDLPPAFGTTLEPRPTAVVDVFDLAPPPPGMVRIVLPAAMTAMQLDADLDSELLVTLYEYTVSLMDDSGSASAAVYRIDLAASGEGWSAAPAVPLVDEPGRVCVGAVQLELGDAIPGGGEPPVPGPELVTICYDPGAAAATAMAFYRTAAGLVGPFTVGSTLAAFGMPVAGDVNGDRLADLAILSGDDREASVAIMLQCPTSDTSACTAPTPRALTAPAPPAKPVGPPPRHRRRSLDAQ